MSKQSVSVTLSSENLLWLRGQAIASGARSISEALDQLISSARSGASTSTHRSVAGTIEVDQSDPDLLKADEYIRSLFARSLDKFPEPKRKKRKAKTDNRPSLKRQNRG